LLIGLTFQEGRGRFRRVVLFPANEFILEGGRYPPINPMVIPSPHGSIVVFHVSTVGEEIHFPDFPKE
jgi:hypothetical protein